jgi:hypothetical protein
MTILSDYHVIDPAVLKLPPCPIPRPGERVSWYTSGRQVSGSLTGFDGSGRPLIINQFRQPQHLESFDEIRPENPFQRQAPNWAYLPKGARVVQPNSAIRHRFRQLLTRPIPPGPSSIEIAGEIWNRGFEIYLVGGTVRDVIAGTESKDIDFVTTMPLDRCQALVSSMYGYRPTARDNRGFLRVGGSPASGDPFVDLKVFSDSLLGTSNAAFGVSFDRDVSHRDFACNSVYFDPINEVLIDPTGIGINDALNKSLTLICGTGDNFQRGQIFIRFFKFCDRGFTPVAETVLKIRGEYALGVRGMTRVAKVHYIKAQILNKCASPADQDVALSRIRDQMIAHGVEQIWLEVFEPLLPQFAKKNRGDE